MPLDVLFQWMIQKLALCQISGLILVPISDQMVGSTAYFFKLNFLKMSLGKVYFWKCIFWKYILKVYFAKVNFVRPAVGVNGQAGRDKLEGVVRPGNAPWYPQSMAVQIFQTFYSDKLEQVDLDLEIYLYFVKNLTKWERRCGDLQRHCWRCWSR